MLIVNLKSAFEIISNPFSKIYFEKGKEGNVTTLKIDASNKFSKQ
jgi:hypothetical protein